MRPRPPGRKASFERQAKCVLETAAPVSGFQTLSRDPFDGVARSLKVRGRAR